MRYLTAGESHGKMLVAILDGFPYGLKLDFKRINNLLARRQEGLGRSERQQLEKDEAEFIAGVCGGITTGAPIALIIKNRAFSQGMDCITGDIEDNPLTALRAGHIDYAACKKLKIENARIASERASGRNSASITALGAICLQLLEVLGITVHAEATEIGGISVLNDTIKAQELIQECRQNGDSVGGKVRVVARGVPAGVGGYSEPDCRLDYILSGHLAAIGGVKGVLIGQAMDAAHKTGSNFHDKFIIDKNQKISRSSNNAGGIEGGISNGEDIIIELLIKPIPTLAKPLKTVDIKSLTAVEGIAERSDVCAVYPIAVVAEAITALVLAEQILKKTGGDSLEQIICRQRQLKEI